jgi:hypothetical protein
MAIWRSIAALAAVAAAFVDAAALEPRQDYGHGKKLVDSVSIELVILSSDVRVLIEALKKSLRGRLDIDNLYAKAEELQNIAYSSPKKNRVIGSVGHNNTVKWLQDYFAKYSDYYTLELQGVPLYVGDSANLTANGKTIEAFAVTLAPSGHISGPLVAVPNLGCDEVRN